MLDDAALRIWEVPSEVEAMVTKARAWTSVGHQLAKMGVDMTENVTNWGGDVHLRFCEVYSLDPPAMRVRVTPIKTPNFRIPLNPGPPARVLRQQQLQSEEHKDLMSRSQVTEATMKVAYTKTEDANGKKVAVFCDKKRTTSDVVN